MGLFEGDKLIAEVYLHFNKDNQIDYLKAQHPEYDAAKHAQIVGDAKNKTREAIRTTPPGPGGFTFLFDGHGLSDRIALSGGIPVQTEQGLVIKADESMCLTPDELAEDFIARRKNFPGSEKNPDILILGTCLSGTYVEQVKTRFEEAGLDDVVIISQTEIDVLGESNVIHPMGNKFFEFLLMPEEPKTAGETKAKLGDDVSVVAYDKEPWNPEQFTESPSMGEITRKLRQNPHTPGSNPRILVPAKRENTPTSDQKKKSRYIQVSEADLQRRLGRIAGLS